MWMGERLNRRDESQITAADMGRTSISGETVAVVSRGELRELEVWKPGGYLWRPKRDDEVLVVKGGTAGEERCVLAAAPGEEPEKIEAGEICLFSDKASVLLRNDGSIELKGHGNVVRISGSGVEVSGGTILLSGSVQVRGGLTINGVACCPGCSTEE